MVPWRPQVLLFDPHCDATKLQLWCHQGAATGGTLRCSLVPLLMPPSGSSGPTRCPTCLPRKGVRWGATGNQITVLAPVWHHLTGVLVPLVTPPIASHPKLALALETHTITVSGLTYGSIYYVIARLQTRRKNLWKLYSCWAWAFYNPRTILITSLRLCWFWCKILALKFLVEYAGWIPSPSVK